MRDLKVWFTLDRPSATARPASKKMNDATFRSSLVNVEVRRGR